MPFSNELLAAAGVVPESTKGTPPPYLNNDFEKKLNINQGPPKSLKELAQERALKGLQKGMSLHTNNEQIKPYTYNAGSDSQSFYKRYHAFGQETFDKIGFSPFKNNDEAFNAQTSFLDRAQRSFVHGFLPLAGRGFVSGPKSLGRMLQGDFGDDPEDAAKYAEAAAIAQDTAGGVGSFFNNSLMNFGYTFGIIGEAIVEEAAITAATGGVGGLLNLPNFGAKILRGARAIKGFETVTDMAGGLTKSLNALANINNARKFFSAAKIGAALETRLGRAVTSTAKFINPAENLLEAGIEIAKNTKQLQGWNKFQNATFKTAGALYRDVRNINMALSEARLEGGFARNDVYSKLVNDYRSKHQGQMPPENVKSAMMAEAEKASKDSMLANTLLIFASNKVTFNNVMNPKSGLARMMAKKVAEVKKMATQTTVREFTKQTLKSGKELLTPKLTTVKGAWATAKKQGVQKTVKAAIGYTKANLMEGVQEVLQEVIAETSKNYHLQSFYSQPVGHYMYTEAERKMMTDKSFGDILGEAFGKQASMQGLETFASGFVMGAFASPLNRAIPFAQESYMRVFKKDEYKAHRDKIDKYVARMTKSVNDTFAKDPLEFLNSRVFSLGTQAELANVIDTGDVKGERDAKEEATIKSVTDLIKMDSLEIWTDYMESLKELTTEEYAEAVGISVEQAQGHVEKLDKVIGRAKEIEKTYKEYINKYPSPIDLNDYKKGTREYEKAAIYHNAWEEARKNVIFYHENYKNTVERMQKIYQSIGNEELLGKIDPNRVQALLKDDRILGEIQVLESEVQGLKGMTDPVSKRKLKQTEATLDVLKEYQKDYENFMDHFFEKGMVEPGTEAEKAERLALDKQVEDKLGDSFKNYMKALAKQSDDMILNDNIDIAFNDVLDHYKLGREAGKLADAVNVLNDPAGFIDHVAKTYDWMYEMWNNREDYIQENISKQLDIIKSNQLLNDMADIGVYVDLDEFADYQETGVIPTEFFDAINKRVIKRGSPIYDKVANRFMELSEFKKVIKESKPVTKNKNDELAKLDAEEAEEISNLPKEPTRIDIKTLNEKDFSAKLINDELTEGQFIDVNYKEKDVEKTATFFKDQDGILREDNAQGEPVDLESDIKYNNGEIYEIVNRPTDADIAEVRKRYDALRAELLERLNKYGPSASTEAMAKSVEEVKAMLLSDDEYTSTRRSYIIKGKAYERMTNRIKQNHSSFKYTHRSKLEDAYDETIGDGPLTEESINAFISKLKSEQPDGFEDYTYTELEEELKSLMEEPLTETAPTEDIESQIAKLETERDDLLESLARKFGKEKTEYSRKTETFEGEYSNIVTDTIIDNKTGEGIASSTSKWGDNNYEKISDKLLKLGFSKKEAEDIYYNRSKVIGTYPTEKEIIDEYDAKIAALKTPASDIKAKRADIERRSGESSADFINRLFQNNYFTEVDGKQLFSLTQGRWGVVVNVNGINIPFYQSTSGTDTKVAGQWYPFFGDQGNWVIKGNSDDSNIGYGFKAIQDVQSFLNENIKEKDAIATSGLISSEVLQNQSSLRGLDESKIKGNEKISLNKEATANRLANLMGYNLEEGRKTKSDTELFKLASKKVFAELAALKQPINQDLSAKRADIEKANTFTRDSLKEISDGTGLAKKGTEILNPDKVASQLKVGDKITFYVERERTGVWDGKYVREDKSNNPFGILAVLSSTDGYIKNQSAINADLAALKTPTEDIDAKRAEIAELERQKSELLKAQPTKTTSEKTYQDIFNEKWSDASGYLTAALTESNKEESKFVAGKHIFEIRPIGNNKFEYRVVNNRTSQNRAFNNYDKFIKLTSQELNVPDGADTIVTVKPGILRKEGDGFIFEKEAQVFYANSSTINNKVGTTTAAPTKVDTTEIDSKIAKAKKELAALEEAPVRPVEKVSTAEPKLGFQTFNIPISRKEDISNVVAGPLVPASEIFWDKNIKTTGSWIESIQGKTGGQDYIEIAYDSLSEENKKIANQLKDSDTNFGGVKGVRIVLGSDLTAEEAQRKSIEIANKFKQQNLLWYKPQTLEDSLSALESSKKRYSKDASKAIDQEIQRIKDTWGKELKPGQYFDTATKTIWASKELYDKSKGLSTRAEQAPVEQPVADKQAQIDEINERKKKSFSRTSTGMPPIGFNYSTDSGYTGTYYAPDGTTVPVDALTEKEVREKINARYKEELDALEGATPTPAQKNIAKAKAEMKKLKVGDTVEVVLSGQRTSTGQNKITDFEDYGDGTYRISFETTGVGNMLKDVMVDEEGVIDVRNDEIFAYINFNKPTETKTLRSVQKELDALNDKVDKLNEQIEEADDAGNQTRAENLRMRRQELYDLLKETAERGKEAVPEIKSNLKNYVINYAIENAYETSKANGIYLDNQFKAVFDPKSAGPVFDSKYITQEAYDDLFGENGYITSIKKRADAGEFYVFSTDLIVYTDTAKDADGNPLPPVAGEIDFIFVDREGRKFIVDLKTGQTRKWMEYNKFNSWAYDKKIDNTLQQVGYANLSQRASGEEFQIAIWPVELNYEKTGYINRAGRPSDPTLMLNQKPIGDLNSEPFIINLDKNVQFEIISPEGGRTGNFMTAMDFMEQYVTGPVTPGKKGKAKPKGQAIPQDESSIVDAITNEIQNGNVIKAGMDANMAKTQGTISDASYKYLIGLINQRMNTVLQESAVLAAPGQQFITINDIFAERFDGIISVESKVEAGEIATVESVDEANEEIILVTSNGDRFTVKFSEMNDYIISPEQLDDKTAPTQPKYEPTQTEIDFTTESMVNVDEFLENSNLRNQATNEADNQSSDEIDNDLYSNLICPQ